MHYFIIPARKGSKGLPFKNRKLFDLTAKTIPDNLKNQVIVSTDDSHIKKLAINYGFNVRERPTVLSGDDVSTRDVLDDVAKKYSLKDNDVIVLLYLTFPQRTFFDIKKGINFFENKNANSILCKTQIDWSPYLCYFELDDGKGKKVIDHDLYRRQDYKPCFGVSHYICILKVNFLNKVDKNLVSPDTIFMEINNPIDIDTMEDIEKIGEVNEAFCNS